MKNRKQLLADFYLELLAQPDTFHRMHFTMYQEVLRALSRELESDTGSVHDIFERMAAEDKPDPIRCSACGEIVASRARHNCKAM